MAPRVMFKAIQELMLEWTTRRLGRLFDAYPGVAMGDLNHNEAAKRRIQLGLGKM